jgi:hypothetical protein
MVRWQSELKDDRMWNSSLRIVRPTLATNMRSFECAASKHNLWILTGGSYFPLGVRLSVTLHTARYPNSGSSVIRPNSKMRPTDQHYTLPEKAFRVPHTLSRQLCKKYLKKCKFVPVLNYLNNMPYRHMGERRYSSTVLYLGIRWRWVVSFTPLSLYAPEKEPLVPIRLEAEWVPELVAVQIRMVFSTDVIQLDPFKLHSAYN